MVFDIYIGFDCFNYLRELFLKKSPVMKMPSIKALGDQDNPYTLRFWIYILVQWNYNKVSERISDLITLGKKCCCGCDCLEFATVSSAQVTSGYLVIDCEDHWWCRCLPVGTVADDAFSIQVLVLCSLKIISKFQEIPQDVFSLSVHFMDNMTKPIYRMKKNSK